MFEDSGIADPRNIQIDVQGSGLSAVFTLDDEGAPVLSNGFDAYQDQARARRRALLVFSGPTSWTLSLGVILDAFGEDRADRLPVIRNQRSVLIALSSLPDAGAPPPYATLTGLTLGDATMSLPRGKHPNQNWALRGMDANERFFDNDSGELVRWRGTLTFSQVASREVLRITQGPHAGFRMHVVKKGETLAGIAKSEGVKIADMRFATGLRIRDPKTVKPGAVLRLPPRSSS